MNFTDARMIAATAALLAFRGARLEPAVPDRVARDSATELHRIATRLHRIAERQCNEDLTCRNCKGEGMEPTKSGKGYATKKNGAAIRCKPCAGTGNTLGRTEKRLEARAVELAAAYRMRVYFQGDPRGCPLYLVPEEIIPECKNAGLAELDRYRYDCDKNKPATLADLQSRWIDSNYTRGHAVPHVN